MKKLMIDTFNNYGDEVLDGLLTVHPIVFSGGSETGRMLHRTTSSTGRVGVVSGGGLGHRPVFSGYEGDVFASPDMNPMLEAIKFADNVLGALCVIGNYGGDKMNFAMACEMAENIAHQLEST